jgi:hypothetical protein
MTGNGSARTLLLETKVFRRVWAIQGRTMFQDNWTLYDDEPAHPKKWIFHPRKRSVMGPLLTFGAAVLVLFEAFSRF